MSLSSYISYALLAVGVGLAGFASPSLIKTLWVGGGVVAGVGVLCCLLSSFVYSGALVSPALKIVNFSKAKQIVLLLIGQSAILLISFSLFYLLEIQTQANARLHFVESAYIVRALQKNPFSLGLLPWSLYSVLGVGLIYLSVRYGRSPFLSRAVLWRKKGKFELFFHNMSATITDIVFISPFLFVVGFGLIWLCEVVNTFLKWDSLFLTPFRTTFICALIIFIFRKANVQLIDWMDRYQASVGKTLMIYMFVTAFFILWLHGSAEWLSLGKEPIEPDKVLKSSLAGFFKEEDLQTRINLLIWGWWFIWIPWMASLVARASIGFSILQAFLHSLLLPLLIFIFWLPKVTMEQWLSLYTWFKTPIIQGSVLIVLLLFIVKAWGNMYTLGDVARGAMVPIGRLTKRPLKRWMHYIIVGLISYIPGWIMLGWLPMQFFVSLNAIFMSVVVAFFVFAWSSFLFQQLLLKRDTLRT